MAGETINCTLNRFMRSHYSRSVKDDESHSTGRHDADQNTWMNKNLALVHTTEDAEEVNFNDLYTYSEFKMTRSNRSAGSNRSNMDQE